VLIVAGSDSGGGAGIQADIKTTTALGAYAATAITALTAQNTRTVSAVHAVPPDFVAEQMRVVLADLGADCIKTGMMQSAAIIDAVSDVLDREARGIPCVVDPVLVAKSGAPLLEPDAMPTLKKRLVLRASLVTPNVPEAELLTGLRIRSVEGMIHAGEMMRTMGPGAALIKGGHLPGPTVTDVLCTEAGVRLFEGPRIMARGSHGTGCTLASAIAAGLAQGFALEHAIERARAYLTLALKAAPGLGTGEGPLDHGVTVTPLPGFPLPSS
jgi:hydroxymethylpyrimidine/phosphomethylpyrimidine kinase